MHAAWIEEARRRLVALREGGGWAYRRGAAVSVEATALASLGLLATEGLSALSARITALRAADRLADLQQTAGFLGPTSALASPGWATSYALLLWQAVGGHDGPRRRAVGWLLNEPVDAPARDPGGISGHDTSIPGWPWVEGTHSWVEPTALTLLALVREGVGGHPRIVDGRSVLRDRALSAGGWNYGNTVVFGRELRPQPAPTGLALLALVDSGVSRSVVDPALTYLRRALPEVRAPASLAWGLLGLRAWGVVPDGAERWLAESAGEALRRDDAAIRLGQLLLASGANGVGFLLQGTAD